VARSFPHTGPGQDERYVVPALARRIRRAKQLATPVVPVGNLAVTREILHVDDVVDAYVRLLKRGESGQAYNVASGRAVTLSDVFDQLCEIVGYRPLPESQPSLMRSGDIPYLVGDAAKLRGATGWQPLHQLEETLQEVVDAQAD
jgi:GDP-4-dehydro-6-deoxy-D-mannose reductase